MCFSKYFSGCILLLLCLSRSIYAQVPIIDGCVTPHNEAVVSVSDENLKVVARATLEQRLPVLRYNPAALPRLSETALTFFYAHECAYVALGMPLKGRTLERARRADCWAFATLQRSKMLKDDDGKALQNELQLSAEDWKHLSGPQREVDFGACIARGNLALPINTPPTEQLLQEDRCVQICGDKLWHCEKSCGEKCRTACEAKFAPCQASCKKQAVP